MSPQVWSIDRRYFYLLTLGLLLVILTGCSSDFVNKFHFNQFDEQLYVDAKLNFAIKHPQNWKRIVWPVSSLEYRADTVTWQVENPRKKSQLIGKMVIQSRPANSEEDLIDLLNDFMADKAELKTGHTELFDHPAGPALKLLGHDIDRGRLIIALKGQQNDFIISLTYPNSHFEDLLPVFQDIVDSFTELIPPQQKKKQGAQ